MKNNPTDEVVDSQHASSTAANWNYQELLERLDNDRAFLCELLTIFRQDSLTGLQEAQDALATKDLARLERKAHTLKGMLRNLLMDRAAEAASGLEAAARQRKTDEAVALLKQPKQAMEELLPEVDAQMAEV